MLTPGQIKEYKFQPAAQGMYRADEVDRFFSTVVAEYEKIYKENGDLLKRAGVLAEKVKEYQEEEELIKKTLIVAQKKADEIEAAAKQKSEESVAAALKESREKTEYAEKRVRELVTVAEERARQTVTQAEQRATDTLRGASITAEQTIGSAKGKAALMLSEAKAKAEDILSDAQKRSDEILGSLKDEVIREKNALETVRAQSKAFKAKLTESYYEQIGMTEQLLGFVNNDDYLGESALEAVQALEVTQPEETTVQSIPEVEKMLEDVQTAAEEKAEIFVQETEPVQEIFAKEPVKENFVSQLEEIIEEPVNEFFTSEPEEIKEEPQAEDFFNNNFDDVQPQESFGGFSFVGGMFDDYEPEEIEETPVIPEVDVADIDDIFSQELNAEKEESEIPEEPFVQEDKPFGKLNEKYMSFDDTVDQNSFFGNVQEETVDDTKVFTAPETAEETVEERKDNKKPEKKKRRLSLFSMYSDDDDDDDDDDFDDDFDDDDDDDSDGGFKGLFRKK